MKSILTRDHGRMAVALPFRVARLSSLVTFLI